MSKITYDLGKQVMQIHRVRDKDHGGKNKQVSIHKSPIINFFSSMKFAPRSREFHFGQGFSVRAWCVVTSVTIVYCICNFMTGVTSWIKQFTITGTICIHWLIIWSVSLNPSSYSPVILFSIILVNKLTLYVLKVTCIIYFRHGQKTVYFFQTTQ